MILGTGGGMALPDGKDASGRKQKVCLILFIYFGGILCNIYNSIKYINIGLWLNSSI